MSEDPIRSLVHAVFQRGQYVDWGEPIRRLVRTGKPGLAAMIETLQDPPQTDQHPIDLYDSIHSVLEGFARTIPDSVIDSIECGELEPGLGFAVLGRGRGQRVVDTLVRGLEHPDPGIRWIVAESLVKQRSARAVPAILAALRDRSSTVQETIVFAMGTTEMYRRPEALPALDRVIANRAIRKHKPHVSEKAEHVRRLILRENPKSET